MRVVSVLMMLVLCSSLNAATITYVGSTEGGEVADWRTAGVSKTMDIDGDNAYGSTLGGIHWKVTGFNQKSAGSSDFGWAWYGSGAQHQNSGYTDIDSITNAPTDADAGIALTSFDFQLTGVTDQYSNRTVRVGVMHDLLSSGEWAADINKGLRLYQTVGGSGDSGTISIRSGGAGDGLPEMYFFDVTGVSAGDRFKIEGLNNVGGAGGSVGYVGPVSWDISDSELKDGDVIAVDFATNDIAVGYNVFDSESSIGMPNGMIYNYTNDRIPVAGVSVTLSSPAALGFGDDPNGNNWPGTASDPYYAAEADDIVYVSTIANPATVTFKGLSPAFLYRARVYALLGNNGTNDETFTVTNGSGTETVTNTRGERWNAATLEAADMVFEGLECDSNGEIAVTVDPNGTHNAFLNAVVLEVYKPTGTIIVLR